MIIKWVHGRAQSPTSSDSALWPVLTQHRLFILGAWSMSKGRRALTFSSSFPDVCTEVTSQMVFCFITWAFSKFCFLLSWYNGAGCLCISLDLLVFFFFFFPAYRNKASLLVKQSLSSNWKNWWCLNRILKGHIRSKDSFHLVSGMRLSSNRKFIFKHSLGLFRHSVIFRHPQLKELSLGLGKGHMETNLLVFRGHRMRVKPECEDISFAINLDPNYSSFSYIWG